MDGTLYPAVSDGDVLDQTIPLPPVDAQRKIVANLDNVLGRSRRARNELDRIPSLIERYRDAVLAAAFCGQLTADWRKQRQLPVFSANRLEMDAPYRHVFMAPSNWSVHSVGDLCEIRGGSQPPKSTFKYEPTDGYVRLIQIRDYKTDQYPTFIPRTEAKKVCTTDDVMIGRYGPPIFQILRGIEGAYNVALMKASPKKGCSREFLYWRLQDPDLRQYVEIGSDRTAGQSGVNKAHLLKYPVFLPSPEEQEAIVDRIRDRFRKLDRVLAEVVRASHLLDRLEQACMVRPRRASISRKNFPCAMVVFIQQLPLVLAAHRAQCCSDRHERPSS